jgi:hypothetical protein
VNPSCGGSDMVHRVVTCAYPQSAVDELWITCSAIKFTGKQLIHIIHNPLWMTCARLRSHHDAGLELAAEGREVRFDVAHVAVGGK